MNPSKLDRIPTLFNFVRNNEPDLESMIKRIVKFASNIPKIQYVQGMPIVKDIVEMGLDADTALRAVEKKVAPNSRDHVYEFVTAFLEYQEMRKYDGIATFDSPIADFWINSQIRIPIRPNFVCLGPSGLFPVHVLGWANFGLSDFQISLAFTILENSIYSLTDFQSSRGEVLTLPRDGKGRNAYRQPKLMVRGEFPTLSDEALATQLTRYLDAVDEAKKILKALQSNAPDRKHDDPPATQDDDRQGKLF